MEYEILITPNGYSIDQEDTPDSKLMRLPLFRTSSNVWDPKDRDIETVPIDNLWDNIIQPNEVNIEADVGNLVVFIGIGIKYVKEKEKSRPLSESPLKAKSSEIQTRSKLNADNSSPPPKVKDHKPVMFKAIVSLDSHKQLKIMQLTKAKGKEEYIGYTVSQDEVFYFSQFRDDTLKSDTSRKRVWNDNVKTFCREILEGHGLKSEQVAVNTSQLDHFRADTGSVLQLLAEAFAVDSTPWVISALKKALEDYGKDGSVPIKFTKTMYRIVKRAPVSDEEIENLVINEIPVCCPSVPVEYLTTDMVKDLIAQMEAQRDLVVPLVHLPAVLGRYAFNAGSGGPIPKLSWSLKEAESIVGTGPGPLQLTYQQAPSHLMEVCKIFIKLFKRNLNAHRLFVNQSLADLEFSGQYGCDLEAVMEAAATTVDKLSKRKLLNDALRVLKLKELTNQSSSFVWAEKLLKLMTQVLNITDTIEGEEFKDEEEEKEKQALVRLMNEMGIFEKD